MNNLNVVKPVMIATSLCLALVFSASSMADGDFRGGNDRHIASYESEFFKGKSVFKKMARHLQLTDTQKQEMKAIRLAAKEQNKALRDSLKQFRSEMKTLSQADVFDEHAFTALYNAYQPSLAQAALTKAKTRHAIYQVLTAEQKQQWQSFMEKRKQKRAKKSS